MLACGPARVFFGERDVEAEVPFPKCAVLFYPARRSLGLEGSPFRIYQIAVGLVALASTTASAYTVQEVLSAGRSRFARAGNSLERFVRAGSARIGVNFY